VRRRHSKPPVQSLARDQRDVARSDRDSLLIDKRLDRMEHMLHDAMEAIDLNGKRLNAVQAQLDHLAAKIRPI
jgi:hypothetical protein